MLRQMMKRLSLWIPLYASICNKILSQQSENYTICLFQPIVDSERAERQALSSIDTTLFTVVRIAYEKSTRTSNAAHLLVHFPTEINVMQLNCVLYYLIRCRSNNTTQFEMTESPKGIGVHFIPLRWHLARAPYQCYRGISLLSLWLPSSHSLVRFGLDLIFILTFSSSFAYFIFVFFRCFPLLSLSHSHRSFLCISPSRLL